MLHVENKHWIEVEHSLFTFEWASHLVVSNLTSAVLTPEQQEVYTNYLTSSAETGVRELLIKDSDDLPYFRLSFIVEGEDERQALTNTSFAALGGLAHAGIDVEDLEFVAAHLAYEEDLKQAVAEAVKTGVPLPNISDMDYQVDPDLARPIYHDIRSAIVDLASL